MVRLPVRLCVVRASKKDVLAHFVCSRVGVVASLLESNFYLFNAWRVFNFARQAVASMSSTASYNEPFLPLASILTCGSTDHSPMVFSEMPAATIALQKLSWLQRMLILRRASESMPKSSVIWLGLTAHSPSSMASVPPQPKGSRWRRGAPMFTLPHRKRPSACLLA